MRRKIKILFLSANPGNTGRIQVDEEEREILERIREGPYRDNFDLKNHAATRPIDLQKLLLMHRPHIIHFCGHGHKTEKIILGGTPGRGKTVDKQGLTQVLGLYRRHVRLVVLNACFTNALARSITEKVDYSVGTEKGIGDKAAVAFAGAFYRALGFGKSVREAFESAKAEIALTKMPHTRGIELFVRKGINDGDVFPQIPRHHKTSGYAIGASSMMKRTVVKSHCRIAIFEMSSITTPGKRICKQVRSTSARRRNAVTRQITPDFMDLARLLRHLAL